MPEVYLSPARAARNHGRVQRDRGRLSGQPSFGGGEPAGHPHPATRPGGAQMKQVRVSSLAPELASTARARASRSCTSPRAETTRGIRDTASPANGGRNPDIVPPYRRCSTRTHRYTPTDPRARAPTRTEGSGCARSPRARSGAEIASTLLPGRGSEAGHARAAAPAERIRQGRRTEGRTLQGRASAAPKRPNGRPTAKPSDAS